jgi:RNA polymerase sigma factor (sigma-70 family)
MSNDNTCASGPGGPRRREGLAALYQNLGGYLRWRAQSALKDSEEAKEVMQETFLAFIRAQPSLRGEASHSTVIQGIFLKQVVNRLRQLSRRTVPIEALDLENEGPDLIQWEGSTGHDGGSGRVEALLELAVLTEGETPQTLRVAYLYLVEEQTFEEISRKLGLRRQVVSQQLHQFVRRVLRRRTRLDSKERLTEKPSNLNSRRLARRRR